MEKRNKLVVLDLNTTDPEEFVEDFRNSVLELMCLLFEKRELDLREPELYSLNVLCRSALRLRAEYVIGSPQIGRQHPAHS